MIKRLLVGAALGFLGKKLYDEGKLDPYIAKAKDKLDTFSASDPMAAARRSSKKADGQPDLAF